LEEEGLRENTIVVYASDHGDFVGRHGMVEKCAQGHNVYEDTMRVPLIFSQPGRIRQGSESDGLVELVDVFPTLLQLAGIDHTPGKHGLDGQSLASALLDGKPVGKPYLVSENWSQAAVITDQHKLGIWLDPTAYAKNRDFRAFGDMLFDHERDPYELKNEHDNPDYADVVKELEDHYRDFVKRIPDTGKRKLVEKAKQS